MGELTTTGQDQLPATRTGKIQAAAGRMFGAAKAGAGRAIQLGGDAAQAGGAMALRMHRRLYLAILALVGLLVLGAVFRSVGWLEGNFVLIGVFGLGALWLFLHPLHLAGMLLLGGGVAVAADLAGARDTLLGYARLLGRVLLVFLIPLLFFALAPGDRSLGSSLALIALAPVAGLALWLFGKVDPRVEKGVLIGLPVAALLIVAGNMLIPPQTLDRIGVPAWLTADRPQDEELARIEQVMERRRNEEQAARLRSIREKLEAGQPLSAEDEALIGTARRDRATLGAWVERQYSAVQAQLAKLGAPAAPPLKPAAPPPAKVAIPARGWSAGVAVPAGFRLCPAPARVRIQCHPEKARPGIWYAADDAACLGATRIVQMRFRSRGGALDLDYRFVPHTQSCQETRP
jgi:hypothetical protein